MKKRTKGILAFAFLGGIMVTSGVVIAIPGINPDADVEMTGTILDNIPSAQRLQFCGHDTAGSTAYITEYQIPIKCTLPLAIASDPSGNIWFMQTNGGNMTKFDPVTEEFTEFKNPAVGGGRTMIWGMDYSSDDSLWYSDDINDAVWRFSKTTEEFQRINFPILGQGALPQRVQVDGSKVIVNDFAGNKITVLDAGGYTPGTASSVDIISPTRNFVTGGFAQDAESNIWYSNWEPGTGEGYVIELDLERYTTETASKGPAEINVFDYINTYQIPEEINAINGIVVANDTTIWLADTETSYFYNLDPTRRSFTQYITSPVPESAYGNQTGVIKTTPLSRPYWMGMGPDGQIIFNEQTANRFGVFEPQTKKLIEYTIPTQNPLWSDCDMLVNCGISQALDFTIVGDKVWFTEWVTNNIGVLDLSIEPAVDISLNTTQIYGSGSTVNLNITANTDTSILLVSNSDDTESIILTPQTPQINMTAGQTITVPFTISVSEGAKSGVHRTLVGVQTPEIAVSQFITLVAG